MKTAVNIAMMLVMMAGIVSAQTSLGLDFYAGAGISIPLKDVKTGWKIGGHGSLAAGYTVTPGLETVVRYAYYSFPSKGDKLDSSFAKSEDKLIAKEASLELRGKLSAPASPIRPYGFIGLGMANLPDDNYFFYSVGGGMKFFALPKISIFVEARYSWVSVTNFSVNYVPITAGINLSL